MTGTAYFDALYANQSDPWGLATSDYEQHKLDVLMSHLPRRRYSRAFEPGCAIGVTTAALSQRCGHLLAMDAAVRAVDQAARRVHGRSVTVQQGRVPDDWPEGPFDLIVLSELLYYLDPHDRERVAVRAARTLPNNGDLVAVHWRTPFPEAATTGEVVHRELTERLTGQGLRPVGRYDEQRFLLQVFHQP